MNNLNNEGAAKDAFNKVNAVFNGQLKDMILVGHTDETNSIAVLQGKTEDLAVALAAMLDDNKDLAMLIYMILKDHIISHEKQLAFALFKFIKDNNDEK